MLLASTELRCLDLIVEAIRIAPTRALAEAFARALALVEAPECTPRMLRLLHEPKAASVARQWLDGHPFFGAEGAAPLAAQRDDVGAEALSYLRALAKRGLDEALEHGFATLPPGDATALRQSLRRASEVALAEATLDELPAWARRCFGDPAELLVEPVVLSDAERHPVPRVELDVPKPSFPAPLPAPLSLPEPPPFDFEACMQRLRRAHFNFQFHWPAANLALPLSREEAGFWYEAYVLGRSPAFTEPALRAWVAAPTPRALSRNPSPELVAPLYVLFGFAGIDAVLRHSFAQWQGVEKVAKDIVPFLSTDARDALRAHLLSAEDPSVGMIELAIRLGASKAEIGPVIRRFATEPGRWSQVTCRWLPFLETPEEMVSEAARLQSEPGDATAASEWLAAAGLAGVPLLAAAIESQRADKASLLAVLAGARAPFVAPSCSPNARAAPARKPSDGGSKRTPSSRSKASCLSSARRTSSRTRPSTASARSGGAVTAR